MKTISHLVLYCMALAAVLPAQPEGAKLMLRKDLGQGRVAEVFAVDVPVDEVYRGPTPEQEDELRKDAERHGRKYRPPSKPHSANRTELYVIEDNKAGFCGSSIISTISFNMALSLVLADIRYLTYAQPRMSVWCWSVLPLRCLLVGCGRLDNAHTNQHPAIEWIKNSYVIADAPIKGRFYSISDAVHVELEESMDTGKYTCAPMEFGDC